MPRRLSTRRSIKIPAQPVGRAKASRKVMNPTTQRSSPMAEAASRMPEERSSSRSAASGGSGAWSSERISVGPGGVQADGDRVTVAFSDMTLGRIQDKHVPWLRPLLAHGAAVYFLTVTGTDRAEGSFGCNVVIAHAAAAIERLGMLPSKRLALTYDADRKAEVLGAYSSQIPILFESERLRIFPDNHSAKPGRAAVTNRSTFLAESSENRSNYSPTHS